MRQLLVACLLLILPAAAFAGEPIDAESTSLVTRSVVRGAVTIALADEGQTVLVAIDEGGDNIVDQVISLDLKGEPTEAVEYQFAEAEVYYVAKERRLQILAPADGRNLLFGNEGVRPLAEPGARLASTPIVHFVTGGFGVSTGWGDLSPAEAIDILRDAKAEAAAARKQMARAEPRRSWRARLGRLPPPRPTGGRASRGKARAVSTATPEAAGPMSAGSVAAQATPAERSRSAAPQRASSAAAAAIWSPGAPTAIASRRRPTAPLAASPSSETQPSPVPPSPTPLFRLRVGAHARPG